MEKIKIDDICTLTVYKYIPICIQGYKKRLVYIPSRKGRIVQIMKKNYYGTNILIAKQKPVGPTFCGVPLIMANWP